MERSTLIGMGLVLSVFGLLAVVLQVSGVLLLVLPVVGLVLGSVVLMGISIFVLARLGAWMKANDGDPRVERLRASFVHSGTRMVLALAVFPLFMAIITVLSLSFSNASGSLLVVTMANAWQAIMYTGMAMFFLAFVRRGREPHCAKCQYAMEGAPAGGYDVCPECGSNLRAKDAIARVARR